ncbi:MAG: hypothetical protein KAS21_03905, partial [Candidatus Aminicenantes bacterium]|nr:hypothetical protein [Candidatus Aminicenantes bacterium]
MTLRKIVFLKFTMLLTILTLFVAGSFVYINIEHHLEDEISACKVRATILAGELSRLLLWNDRVAVKRVLIKEQRADNCIGYLFVEKDGVSYEHTFDRGIPESLLKIGPATSGEPAMWKFISTEGDIYYDIFVNIDSSDSELHIGLSKDLLINELYPHFGLILIISILIILIGAVISYFFALRITSEINILSNSISSYIKSGKEFDIDLKETEAKEIVSAFNKMIEKQRKTEISLKQSEKIL